MGFRTLLPRVYTLILRPGLRRTSGNVHIRLAHPRRSASVVTLPVAAAAAPWPPAMTMPLAPRRTSEIRKTCFTSVLSKRLGPVALHLPRALESPTCSCRQPSILALRSHGMQSRQCRIMLSYRPQIHGCTSRLSTRRRGIRA